MLVTGITTLTGDLDASYVGASSTVFATQLGVGTTQAPANDIQVRKSGDAEVHITSETGTARLILGRETGVSNTNNAELRYGGVTGQPYSEPQSLDILNYGVDNFNYYLSQNNAGAVIGDFHWLKGVSTPLMTLSSGGNLGIGLTTPTVPLQVVGNSNISGDAVFGGDINLTGTIIGNIQGNLVGNVNGQFSGNVNATTGVSTFTNLTISGVGTAEDYQVVPLSASQEIIKVRSSNRSASGISRAKEILDPTGAYSNVSVFADDGIIYSCLLYTSDAADE